MYIAPYYTRIVHVHCCIVVQDRPCRLNHSIPGSHNMGSPLLIFYVLVMASTLFNGVTTIESTETDCEGPNCLHLYYRTGTWQDSYDACRSEGLELVRIENGQIQAAVERLLRHIDYLLGWKVWTAGRGSSDDTWRYINGSEFIHAVNYAEAEFGYCMYGTIYPDSMQYNALECSKKLSNVTLVCQYDQPKTGSCGSDLFSGGKCYAKTQYDEKYAVSIDWFGGQTYCSETYDGGVVPDSTTPDMYKTIINHLGGGEGPVNIFLGVKRRIWHWRTGPDRLSRTPMNYFRWDGKAADGKFSYNYCVLVHYREGFRWTLWSCFVRYASHFICMNTSSTPSATSTTPSTPSTPGMPHGTTVVTQNPSGDDVAVSGTTMVIVGTVIGVLVLAIIGLAVALILWKRKVTSTSERNNGPSTNHESPVNAPVPDVMAHTVVNTAYDEICDQPVDQRSQITSNDYQNTGTTPPAGLLTVNRDVRLDDEYDDIEMIYPITTRN